MCEKSFKGLGGLFYLGFWWSDEKRILCSGFPLATALEKELCFSLCKVSMGITRFFLDGRLTHMTRSFLIILGWRPLKNKKKGIVFSDCVRQEHPSLLANSLANQSSSRMVCKGRNRFELWSLVSFFCVELWGDIEVLNWCLFKVVFLSMVLKCTLWLGHEKLWKYDPPGALKVRTVTLIG